MNGLLSFLAKSVVFCIQMLPLGVVARLGRLSGSIACLLDGRHRRVAQRNLARCFPEKSTAEIRFLARENFKRIGESFACAAKTASMTDTELLSCLSVKGAENFQFNDSQGQPVRNVIIAIGHFGNFELYARTKASWGRYKMSTTYRALAVPALNEVMMQLRHRSDCQFFERRTQARELRQALEQGGYALGLLADQNVGRHGVRIPFFGQPCYTSIAPSVMALRYDAPLYTGVCFRIRPGQWVVEWGAEIPVREHGQPRRHEDIMLDINRVFEAAVRRDPANWFWVHNRWRAEKLKKTRNSPQDETQGPPEAEGNDD